MLLAIIDHGGVRYYLLELIISTFDYVESHIQVNSWVNLYFMYYMFIYLQAQSANFTYLIFDIPKIKLYAAHTCINMAQILIPMFQFLCV